VTGAGRSFRPWRTKTPRPDHSLDVKRIEAALANLRKQHLWGAIDDGTFKAEHRVLQRQVKSIQPSSPQLMMPNLDRASRLLQDLPAYGTIQG